MVSRIPSRFRNMNPFETGVVMLDDCVKRDINSIHIPKKCVISDHPHWAFNSKGMFNIKSMHDTIRSIDNLRSLKS